MKNQLEELETSIVLLKYEENPYIRLLDEYLNYHTGIIKICFSYLPIDYCLLHKEIFPRDFSLKNC